MGLDEIVSLPVADVTEDNCALFFWSVWPRLFDAKTVIDAWGFSYRTLAFVWVKLNKNSMGLFTGMGYYGRANTEPCLLAVRGRMPVEAHDVLSVIMSPIREHSQKPSEQYDKIERLYPNGNYLELFARNTRPNWTSIGHGIDGKDIRVSLLELAES